MGRVKGLVKTFFTAMALMGLAAGIAMAATGTETITYQGKLTDAAGSPLTGTYSVKFSIYGSSSGGTALSTDTHSVTAENGLFTTSITIADPKVVDGRALYLGITVGADPEMTPRQAFRPVPYAISLRDGAWIRSLDNLPVLNLKNIGGGIGLNVSTTTSSSDGIVITTAGGSSEGVTATTSGVFSHGFSALAGGDDAYGLYARTGGDEGHGVVASTSGPRSAGVAVATAGYRSPGFRAVTGGSSSDGISVTTFGPSSNGVYIRTSGAGGQGVNVSTTGNYGDGLFIETSGDYADGINVKTHGQSNYGMTIETDDRYSSGISIATAGYRGLGVNVYTDGENSEGVDVQTHGDYAEGVISWTFGDSAEAMYAHSEGAGSLGIFAISNQATAVYAITNREDNKYGFYTPDYLYAKGTQVPAADVAEYLPVTADVEAGTVLVIGSSGSLEPASAAYDTRVAGIVSTDPGVTLGTKEDGNPGEAPVAVTGRVPCRVDARYGAIRPGDLLSTSATPGHAMKASPVQVNGIEFYRDGTVLGKAMGSLESGTGTIDVLVTLQ